MKPLGSLLLAAPLALAACGGAPAAEAPLAGSWVLEPERSRVNFVSVKGGEVAEPHHFTRLTGSVGADGAAELVIDLASVETEIDIRNERMRTMLFDLANFPQARIAVALDPQQFASLATGQTMALTSEAAVTINGMEQALPAALAITRIAPDLVQVDTRAPIIVNAASFDLAQGVERLRAVAGLPSIAGQVPVMASLTFARQ